MTFLNPFLLFGLAAASIPILIHLFNKRKLRTVDFSTLSFLKELNRTTIRRITIRQWLLLALRTIIILLLVLAFSRPALHGSFGSSAARARSTVVIIIDDSPSMMLSNERGSFLSQAKEKAASLLSLTGADDDLYCLRTSVLPDAGTAENFRDRSVATSFLRTIEPASNAATIETALRNAASILSRSHNANQEVYVLTDGQRSSFAGKEMTKAADRLFDPRVRFFVMPLSEREQENCSIGSVTIPPSLIQRNKPVPLQITVKNHGRSPVQNRLVSILIDGDRVAQQSVSLAAGASSVIDVSFVPSRSGILRGTVALESDRYEPDDVWFFTVNVPSGVSVLLVAPDENNTRFPAAALTAAMQANPASGLSVSSLRPAAITSALLASADVVILSGVQEVPASTATLLRQWITNGGAVLYFPSSDSVHASSSLAAIGLPALLHQRTTAVFEKTDLQFPVFSGIFEKGGSKPNSIALESPQITAVHAPVRTPSLRSIIALSNGSDFLWQTSIGSGRVLGFSVPATMEGSDFPMKGLFVPLLYQSVLYLSSPASLNASATIHPGEAVELSASSLGLKRRATPNGMRLIDPEQRPVPVRSYVRTTGSGGVENFFSADPPRLPGLYLLKDQEDTAAVIPVNSTRTESNGTLTTDDDRTALFTSLGVDRSAWTTVAPSADLQTVVTESRYGVELWRTVLLLAALVAVIEMFVARDRKE